MARLFTLPRVRWVLGATLTEGVLVIGTFACTLFFGQTLGVAGVARSLDAGWMSETFLLAALGVAVLCHVIALGGQKRIKTS